MAGRGEADLGRRVRDILDGTGWGINPIGPVDLDGDGGDEILYYNGLEAEEIGVLDLVGPALVDLAVPATPGITSQNDGQGRLRAWWLEEGTSTPVVPSRAASCPATTPGSSFLRSTPSTCGSGRSPTAPWCPGSWSGSVCAASQPTSRFPATAATDAPAGSADPAEALCRVTVQSVPGQRGTRTSRRPWMHSMRSSRPGPIESPSSWRGVSVGGADHDEAPVIRLTSSSVCLRFSSTRQASGIQEKKLRGCRITTSS